VFRFEDLRVAVLGAGKIGSMLALGFRDCGARVIATARRRERVEELRAMGLDARLDNVAAVKASSVIVVSVKPYQYPALAKQIGPHVAGKAVVSVMAGVPLRLLRATLPGAEVYRAMPNINAAVKKSATAIVAPSDSSFRDLVFSLFRCVGTVYELSEQLIDAWTAVAGSGPALIAEFIDALILGALAVGIPRHVAYDAILETLVGTAEYLRSRPEHPAALRDEVTTPGGTTIRALKALEARGMKAAIIDAVEKATSRARTLAREIEEELLENTG